jgi:membrane associated rhomboid family serine protease
MFNLRVSPGIKNILIATVGAHVLALILVGGSGYNYMSFFFALSRDGITDTFFIWQFVTYMFMHDTGGFMHILFNMFFLWMFGTELEEYWGTKRFYSVYFLGGIAGGLLHIITTSVPTIGASAGVMAIVTAFGFMFPNRPIYLWGILPVPAKWMVIGYISLDLIGAFQSVSSTIAHFAHLGGALVGFLVAKNMLNFNIFNKINDQLKKIIKVRKVGEAKQNRRSDFHVNPGSTEHEKYDFYQKKVDELLDKISKVGYLNLSDEERDVLDRASHFIRNYDQRKGN